MFTVFYFQIFGIRIYRFVVFFLSDMHVLYLDSRSVLMF